MDMSDALGWLQERLLLLNWELFRLGETEITLGALVRLLLLGTVLLWAGSAVRRWLADRLLVHLHLEPGTRYALASMARYLVLGLGAVLILQNLGIQLGALGMVAGAVGVGVGFGLQNIVSNFISGLIIMLERPIKVGDRVEVASVEGVVHEISARRTTVVTSDNVAILIPNQRFILDNVVNLAYLEAPVRLRVSASLAPETDVAEVERLLARIARDLPGVMDTPAPHVLWLAIGAAARQFELAVWYEPARIARDQLKSELNRAIAGSFAAHDIRFA